MLFKAQIIDEHTGEELAEVEAYSISELEEKLYKLEKYYEEQEN